MTDEQAIFPQGAGLSFLTGGLLSAPHGFSTRLGGVSREAPLASLNLGYGRGEEDALVEENYRRFFAAIGIVATPAEAVWAEQIHSSLVRIVYTPGVKEPCDGFATRTAGLVLTVRVADCMPILLEDPASGAVAALHAGWQGTVKDIAGAGVAALKALGACPATIRAVLGPSARSCCYEVGEDFYKTVSAYRGAAFASAFIVTREGKRYADLAGMNRSLLLSAGLLPEHIELLPYCTICRDDLFYSHRRQGAKRGSMAAAILCRGSLAGR